MGEDVPPPETAVILDGCRFRCELVVYIVKHLGHLKDVRVRGPLRETRREALRDCLELRKAALKSGRDPGLCKVHNKRIELMDTTWTEKDLGGHELDFAEGPAGHADPRNGRATTSTRELAARAQDNQRRIIEQRRTAEVLQSLREPAPKRCRTEYRPVGPNWQKPGPLCPLPDVEDAESWLIHERQDPNGKYRPWLFFDVHSGRYFQQKESGSGFLSIGLPHDPQELAICARVASASLPSTGGKKLDAAVLLPELHKTGFLLKQPLDFLDKPASLAVLFDALRGTGAAAEFCVRRLHSLLLPRLSARVTEWEDFELVDVLSEAVEALDSQLLESPVRFAGCALAVALVLGTRLLLGCLGGTRIVLCGPPAVEASREANGAVARPPAAPEPWVVHHVLGGHEVASCTAEECARVGSAGGCLLAACGTPTELHSRSLRAGILDAVSDESDREFLRIARASNVFATLGVSMSELTEGPAAIRRLFRRRSLVVHPDKATEGTQQRAMAAFTKLEAAAKAVEALLHADAKATELLMEVCEAYDKDWVEADPAAAARLLGVQQGCDTAAAKGAVKQRYHSPLSRVQDVCKLEVARALKILDMAVEAATRGSALWIPPPEDEAVHVTRALGCADLKSPRQLLSTGVEMRLLEFTPGPHRALALLADGARGLEGPTVAAQMQRLAGRPRAAALRLALNSAAALGDSEAGEAVGVACAFLNPGPPPPSQGEPQKRVGKASSSGRCGRVRVSHVLLRWPGLKGAESELRPGFGVPTRTQPEAERELLELLEELLAQEPKARSGLFKAAVVKRSECPSALNVPYADLGWVEAGGTEPALEAVAFDTPIDGISDIAVTSMGAHLLYRLA